MVFDPNKFVDPDSPGESPKAMFDPQNFVDPDQPGVKPVGEKKMESSIPSGQSVMEEFQRGAYGFTRGAQQGAVEVGQGLRQAATAAAERAGLARQGAAERYTARAQAQRAAFEKSIATREDKEAIRGGRLFGGIAPYMAVPGGVAGGLATRIGTGAAAGGAIGAAQFVPEEGSRTRNALMGAVLGGGVTGILGAAKGLLGLGRQAVVDPMTKAGAKAAVRKGLGQVDDVARPRAEELRKTAEEIDTFISPGEATRSEILLAEEGRLAASRATQFKLETKLGERAAKTKEALKKVVNKTIKEPVESLQKEADTLYKKVGPEPLPQKSIKALEDDPIISKFSKDVSVKPEYKADVGRGTIGHYNNVKRILDDKIKVATNKIDPKSADKVAAKNFSEAREKLIKVLDDASPEYAKARSVAQAKIIKEKYINKIDESGDFNTLAKQMFPKQKSADEFINDMVRMGANKPQVKKLVNFVNAVKNTKLESVLKKAPAEAVGKFETAQGATATAFKVASSIAKKRFNEGMFDLLTNNKWNKLLTEAAKKPTGAAAISVLAKLGAVEGTRAEAKEAVKPVAVIPPKVFQQAKQDKVIAKRLEPIIKKLPNKQQVQEAAKQVPKERKQSVLDIALMPADKYYQKYLNTDEKRKQYLAFIKQKGGNMESAVAQMRKLAKVEEKLAQTKGELKILGPKEKKNYETFFKIMSVIFSILFGAVLGKGFFKRLGQEKVKEERERVARREKAVGRIGKLEEGRQALLGGIIGKHIGTATKK